eukprot:scaffold10546_cov114-Isochrysis_galbana.AAC.6
MNASKKTLIVLLFATSLCRIHLRSLSGNIKRVCVVTPLECGASCSGKDQRAACKLRGGGWSSDLTRKACFTQGPSAGQDFVA